MNLSEEDIDRIAEILAEKIEERAKKRGKPIGGKPSTTTADHPFGGQYETQR
jgi:hypothetical protein